MEGVIPIWIMCVSLDLKMLLLEVVGDGIWMVEKVWIARESGNVLLLDPRRRSVWAHLRLEVASTMVPLVLLAWHNKHGRGF